jgi:Lar family restriction alleviation protein
MKTVKLKFKKPDPCPFCGGEARVFGSGVIIAVHVHCSGCRACGPEFNGRTELAATKRAVTAWNTRITFAPTAARR